MNSVESKHFTLTDLLNAADKYYPENYLSSYFDRRTGASKTSSGDSLAKFIVRELRESFYQEPLRRDQVSAAVSVLRRAQQDLQRAITGIRELEAPHERA